MHLAPAALIGLLTAAAPAQLADLEKTLQEAEKLHEAKKGEAAAYLLQQALQKLAAMPATAAQVEVTGRVEALVAKVDPRSERQREGLTEAAGHLAALAKSFRQRQWYRVSLSLLREADAIDARVATKELAILRRASPKAFRSETKSVAPKKEPVTAGDEYKKFVAADYFAQGWTITPDLITSPPMAAGDKEARTLLCSAPQTRDGVFSIEVKQAEKTGALSIVFGGKDVADFFLLETARWPDRPLRVRLLHYVDEEWNPMGERVFPVSDRARSGWLLYSFRIEGKNVKVTIAGRDVLEATCQRPPHGKIGMQISPALGPVSKALFRRPKIEELSQKPKEEVALVADRSEQRVLLAAIANAEAGYKRDRQRALITLFAAQRRAADIKDQKLRDAVLAAARRLLPKIYSGHRKIHAARVAAAAVLQRTATAYTNGLWYRTADRLLRTAASLDYPTVAVALQKSTERMSRLATRVEGVDAEDLGGADNTLLHKWFKGGRRLKGRGGWSHGDAALVPSTDFKGDHLLISTQKLEKPAVVRLQVKAVCPVHFGVVLGYKSQHDYYQLSVEHGSVDTRMQLYRFSKGGFKPVSTPRSLSFTKAAQKAWMTLHLDIWEKSLLVKLGKARKQVIWIGESIPGNIGLFLRVRDDHHGVKFRNLVVKAKKPNGR